MKTSTIGTRNHHQEVHITRFLIFKSCTFKYEEIRQKMRGKKGLCIDRETRDDTTTFRTDNTGQPNLTIWQR